MWTEQSDLGPHCLPVFKNGIEKFARIFSRRHKQTTFSDVGFLGVLRVIFAGRFQSAGRLYDKFHTLYLKKRGDLKRVNLKEMS